MTEVPEHLLARSRARRAAAGAGAAPAEATPSTVGEVEVAGGAAPASATPAAAPAPVPAAAPPPPPKPDPPYVQAYKDRPKIPWWAMPVVAMLPIWAFIYWQTLEPPPEGTEGPLAEAAAIYSAQCASCHGAEGGGGVGPAFTGGAVVQTWPNYQDHIEWVSLGSAGWPGGTYGAQDKPKRGGMPAFADTLSPAEIALVVRYEREVLAEAPPEPELVALTEGGEGAPGGAAGGRGDTGDAGPAGDTGEGGGEGSGAETGGSPSGAGGAGSGESGGTGAGAGG